MIHVHPIFKKTYLKLSGSVCARVCEATQKEQCGLIYTDFNILFTDESLTFYLLT